VNIAECYVIREIVEISGDLGGEKWAAKMSTVRFFVN